MTTSAKRYKLYATTIDDQGHQHSEGPYHFDTPQAAVAWLREQTTVTVVSVEIYDGEEKIAEAS